MSNNSYGQATIEFLMTFIFAVGFLFAFVSLALNMATGYMVHYATYMASRTYLVYDNGSASPEASDRYAEDNAKEVFDSYHLTKLGVHDAVFTVLSPDDATRYEYVGVRTTFEKPLSFFKLMGGGEKAKMISESFLGREPTRGTCLHRVCKAVEPILQKSGLGGGEDTCESPHVTLFDNGC